MAATLCGLPVYSVADIDDIYGRVVAYERLLLPFLTDDKVSHVIASLKTFCEDGGFEIKNLLRGNDALPRPKLRTVIDRDCFTAPLAASQPPTSWNSPTNPAPASPPRSSS